MKPMLPFFLLALNLISCAQPTISFTFDDGSTQDYGTYEFREWNNMILKSLDNAELKSILFVKTKGKANLKGQELLKSWNEKGHGIANHTFSHPNLNRSEVSSQDFKLELLKADSLLRNYSNFLPLFRFPYLKEGDNQNKVNQIRQTLSDNNYKNGYVTIDASDWYIDSRLRQRLRENPEADIEAFKKFYLNHILERATFYETLSFGLTERHISHTLLLHHNLSSALFLDDLIEMFQKKGWNTISAKDAYHDAIFKETPLHAGESLIWALAKDSGKYEEVLRYPAEDSRYEKKEMDDLGL